MEEGTDTSILPDKTVQEQEKNLFTNYQPIMLRFLHESSSRQMIALYALQVFCYENQFPKGSKVILTSSCSSLVILFITKFIM